MNIITTHKNTDFDALASVIGATLLYPQSIGVIPKMVNRNVERFLSTHKSAFNLMLPNEVDHSRVTQLTVVDTNQWHRLDRMEKLRKHPPTIHLWDHHHQPGNIEAQWKCVEFCGAATSLLVRELKRKHIPLSPLDSTVLLIGIYEDTGHLTYPSTTSVDMEAAKYLLDNGADLNVASYILNPPYEESQKNILFKLLETTEKFSHKKLTVGLNILKLEEKVPMLSSVVNMYRKLINVDAVFIIVYSDANSCTIISRSGSDRIDVGAILVQFGGGGHPGAASATIRKKGLNIETIKAQLIDTVKKNRIISATVADLMSYPVVIVPAETSMKKVREIMEEHSIRGVLVGTTDDPEGIIVLSDLKKLKKDRQWKSPVKAFMARNLSFIKPNEDPAEAAQLMVSKNIGHLPVKHNDKIIGIITRTDILTYFYDMLPD